MGMYSEVRGWIKYFPGQKDALRSAIASAVAQAEEKEYAEAVATNWRFIEELFVTYGSDYAFWGGYMRNGNTRFILDQVKAVAAVIGRDNAWLPDGRPGHDLQGSFIIDVEGGPRLEWRVFNREVYEREIEVPTWVAAEGWDIRSSPDPGPPPPGPAV